MIILCNLMNYLFKYKVLLSKKYKVLLSKKYKVLLSKKLLISVIDSVKKFYKTFLFL